MDITFSCSHCGQTLVVDEAGSGMSVDCPKCDKPVYVPAKPRSVPDSTSRIIEPPQPGKRVPLDRLPRTPNPSLSPSAPITLSGHDLALSAGESVILQERQHGVVIVLPIIVSLVVGASLALIVFFATIPLRMVLDLKVHPAVFLIPLLPLLFFAVVGTFLAWLGRKNSLATLTNRRLIINSGILAKTTVELLLKQIETVAIHRPLLGRVFGYGTIRVRGTGGGHFPLCFIEDPEQFYGKLQGCIEVCK